jgi:hypothetical protein
MTTDELIKAFGGKEGVMSATGQARNTVNHWVYVGIPWRHWPALKTAATKRRIRGITDEALAGTRRNLPARPPKKRKAKAECRCRKAA